MKKTLLIIGLSCFLLSCSHSFRYSDDIESVLKQAGDNREELEKVLKHYSRHHDV